MGYVAGPTILRWGRSRTPIGPSSPMSRDGCVDGCASSMRSAAADVTGSRISTCTISWAWFRSETSCTTFRGRPPECLVREPSAGKPLARFDDASDATGPASTGYQVDDLIVDVGQQRVTRAGTDIPLPHLSFKLLVALARAAPDLVSFHELTERV